MAKKFDDAQEDEFLDEDFEFEDDLDEDLENVNDVEVLSAILKSASKSANNLTALIVENNNRNNVTMSSEDIYDIFRNSFIVALTTISPTSVE